MAEQSMKLTPAKKPVTIKNTTTNTDVDGNPYPEAPILIECPDEYEAVKIPSGTVMYIRLEDSSGSALPQEDEWTWITLPSYSEDLYDGERVGEEDDLGVYSLTAYADQFDRDKTDVEINLTRDIVLREEQALLLVLKSTTAVDKTKIQFKIPDASRIVKG